MTGARSYLFVPGDSPRKLARAMGCGADVLILDLEDAVAADAKPAARALVAEALGADGPPRLVRVNSFASGLIGADLAAVMAARPAAILLPKYERPEDLVRLDGLIGELEAAHGVEPGSAGVVALVAETAAGLLALAATPPRHPRLRGLMWGAEDLAADIGALTNRDAEGRFTEPFRLARSLCLMAAVAAGVDAIDAVHTNLDDSDGLLRECLEARRDGFNAKAAIHPDQVETIHRGFAPTETERLWAERALEALAAAGAGAVRLDGEMLDEAHRRRAERILAAARAGG